MRGSRSKACSARVAAAADEASGWREVAERAPGGAGIGCARRSGRASASWTTCGPLAAGGDRGARRDDSGHTWGGRLLEMYEPRTTLHSAAYAIGLGLSTAIGASIGRPDVQVVLIAGDGGFAASAGRAGHGAPGAGARDRGACSTTVATASCAICRTRISTVGGLGSTWTTPDYVELGRAFGMWAGQVRAAAELRPQLTEALQQRLARRCSRSIWPRWGRRRCRSPGQRVSFRPPRPERRGPAAVGARNVDHRGTGGLATERLHPPHQPYRASAPTVASRVFNDTR